MISFPLSDPEFTQHKALWDVPARREAMRRWGNSPPSASPSRVRPSPRSLLSVLPQSHWLNPGRALFLCDIISLWFGWCMFVYVATRKSHFPCRMVGILFLFSSASLAVKMLFTVITWRMKIFPGQNKPDQEKIITQNWPSQRIFHHADDELSARKARAEFSAAQIHTSTRLAVKRRSIGKRTSVTTKGKTLFRHSGKATSTLRCLGWHEFKLNIIYEFSATF